MTNTEILSVIATALDRKKAEDIKIIKISDLSVIADYFVIADGMSITQTKALADEVEFRMKEKGISPARIQGNNGGGWIILDYSDIIVHIFSREQRDFYDLERLWRDGEQIDASTLIEEL